MEDKKYSVYIHKVETEDGPMYYTGVTKDVKNRWQSGQYKKCSLWPYIEQYGWKSIEHVVVIDGLDYEKSREVEDMLICCYDALGRRINKQRSGLIEVTDRNAYLRNIRSTNPKYYERQYQRQRERYSSDQEYAERMRKRNRDRYANNKEFAEQCRKRNSKWRSTQEGKIYMRVKDFNRKHPDRAVETPMEAKRKYLDSGGTVIPQYIKHDDIDGPAE